MKPINIFILSFIIYSGCNDESIINNSNGEILTDTLYVGGKFLFAGEQPIKNIAMWDGKNWHSLGKGITGQNAVVECMVIYRSELYVGGFIDSADGIPVKNIAKWNGVKWSSVGGGINSRVTSLAVYKDELYAGGWFTIAGGIKAGNIAKWNGVSWSPVGAGFSDEVYTLCIYNNELYAGGWFTKNISGFFQADNIARWNGLNWDTVGNGTRLGISGGSWIKTLTVFNNELYASGNFSKCGYLDVTNIVKWSNSAWYSVSDNAISNRIYTAAEYKNEIHFAGNNDSNEGSMKPYYSIWDGAEWSFNKFTFDETPFYFYSFNNFLYIGGKFRTVNNKSVNSIFRWDGENIQSLGTGVQGYVSSILSPKDLKK